MHQRSIALMHHVDNWLWNLEVLISRPLRVERAVPNTSCSQHELLPQRVAPLTLHPVASRRSGRDSNRGSTFINLMVPRHNSWTRGWDGLLHATDVRAALTRQRAHTIDKPSGAAPASQQVVKNGFFMLAPVTGRVLIQSSQAAIILGNWIVAIWQLEASFTRSGEKPFLCNALCFLLNYS